MNLNIFSQLPNAIALLDYNMCYVAYSQKWAEIFELDKKAIIGKNHYEVFPEISDEWKQLHKRCLQGEFIERQVEKFVRKSGKIQYIKGSLTPWKNEVGKIVGIIIQTEDVTEKEILKQALDSERKLFSEGPVMIFKWLSYQGNWDLEYFSPNVEKELGYSKQQIQKNPIFDFIHPEDLQRVKNEIKQYKTKKAESFSQEYRVRKSSGEHFWVFDFTYFNWSPDGELLSASTYIFNIDIQKKYENELYEKNKELEAIFNAIPGTYFKLKKDGTLLSYFTSNNDDIYLKNKTFVGRNIKHLLPEKASNNILKAIEFAFKEKKLVSVEYKLRLEEENRYYEAKISPINETDAIAVVSDVSEKRANDINIRESETRYRTIIEQTGQIIYDFDIKTGEIIWGGAVEKILGFSLEEISKYNIKDRESLLHPDNRDEVIKKLNDSIHQTGRYHDEYLIQTKLGEYIYVEDNGVVVYDNQGAPSRLLGTMKDISSLKISEQNLLLEKDRLEGIIEATKVGSTEWNIQTGERFYNERWANIIGYTLDELKPLNDDTWKKVCHPEDYKKSQEMLKKLFNKEITYYDLECRLKHKNGNWVWVHDKGKIVRWTDDGKPLLMLGALNDISERKAIELEKKETLNLLNEQNKRLLNFAHIVSHNLRSHTSNFQGLLELYDYETDPQEKEKYIQLLKSSSEMLNETIYNLNEVVNINTSLNEKKDFVDLKKILEDIQKNICVMISNNDAQIIYQFPENFKIKTIPAYLESILLNLITNGIKYKSPERKPEIKIEVKVRGKLTILILTDNGLGIDMEKYGSKLFGMYQTFHGNKDARGIGLFIIKNQIEAMGGKIKVKSKVGKGTTWKVYLYDK